ncbi:TorD/DmsD family molecular chaperone [Denitratisoma oestradiolicum]|uniref:Respiratory arsenate reductase cytoplasmic chaperone n=1 Tax=Denitratisoma oestradiolicum TaxID=311182 RepID=A0A6S6YN23_9PROT|nr:molecular chaperone TorD family protein [Denitratisoma oestradiolicum]CAB1369146.1 Respiratory arsenate reductase cytoplasmic chaperone [Denitratisoma oestradiolicum]
MNALTQAELDAAAMGDLTSHPCSVALARARLYHFLELALAHPGEDGFDYFRQESTEQEYLDIYAGLLEQDAELSATGLAAASAFFARLKELSFQDVEAAHIALFSANYPRLPCPPYGSLYTAPDSEKRLAAMLEIKEFYQQNGVDIADTFDDLPDHLCVELEFSHLLCFRENAAVTNDDADIFAGVQHVQAEFLDKFLLPLGNSLADHAAAAMPDNLYADLLATLRCFLLQHRRELGTSVESSSQDQEIQS